jgi:hypothetical protein
MIEKSELSKTITTWFVKFDDHCFVYFFLIGAVAGAIGPHHDPWGGGLLLCALGSFLWYVCKAFLICGETAATMIARGEPLFKSGEDCMTEYDRNKAKLMGKYVADAFRNERERSIE